MNLKEGRITVGEVLFHPGAQQVLSQYFPKIMGNPLALNMAKNWSINQVMEKARGHFPPEHLAQARKALEQLP